MGDNDLPQERRRRLKVLGDQPEDEPGEPGAEGGSASPAADALPGHPAPDTSPLGDSDQHSSG